MANQLVNRVHDYLIAQLAARSYPQGTHLNAREIAEELDVSRATVNKAIDRLVELGFAQRDGGRRPVVAGYPDSLSDQELALVFDGSSEADRVYSAIREMTLRGDFKQGQFINAKGLAEQLQTTIPAVRQALHQATAAGMFEHRPRKGWRAVQHNADEINDAYRVRLFLEPLLVKRAAMRISDKQINDLAARINALKSAADIPRSELREADYHFHRTLLDVATRRILTDILDPLIHKLFLQPSIRDVGETLSEHEAILDALRSRDRALAAQRMREHLRKSRASYFAAALESNRKESNGRSARMYDSAAQTLMYKGGSDRNESVLSE
jgi:GntR family transcriptional regulator, rspAB operon transcriptional repressor